MVAPSVHPDASPSIPAAPAASPRSRRLAIAASLAVLLALLALRRPDALTRPQLCAEDGIVFFLGAYNIGPRAIFQPYAGYLHLIPRLVAAAATHADPLRIPLWYNLAALAVWLGVGALVFNPRLELPAKPALVAALALAPQSGTVIMSLTNIQWIAAIALVIWMVADPPRTRRGWIGTGAGLILCGLTGPFSVFLTPAFALRWLCDRSAGRLALAALVAATGLVQLAFMLRYAGYSAHTFSPHGPLDFPGVMIFRCLGDFFAGYGPSPLAWPRWIPVGAALLAALAAGVVLAPAVRRPAAWLALAALLVLAPVAVKFAHDPVDLQSPLNGDRYFLIVHVMLAWILILLAARGPRVAAAAAGLALAGCVAGSLRSFRIPPLPDRHWSRYVEPIRAGRGFAIPINPAPLVMPSAGRDSQRGPPAR